jgi:hypothetical protein
MTRLSDTERQLREDIIDELAEDDAWEFIQNNSWIRYVTYLGFRSDRHFVDTRGRSGIILLSSRRFPELVSKRKFYWRRLAWVPSMAVDEIVPRKALGIPICVVVPSRDSHVKTVIPHPPSDRQTRKAALGRLAVTRFTVSADIGLGKMMIPYGHLSFYIEFNREQAN